MNSKVHLALEQIVKEIENYVYTQAQIKLVKPNIKKNLIVINNQLKIEPKIKNQVKKSQDEQYVPGSQENQQSNKIKIEEQQYSKQISIRASSKEGGRSKVYSSYPYEFKVELVEQIKQMAKQKKIKISKAIKYTSQKYKIHPKNLTRWIHADDLKERRGNRKAMFPQMEENLALFCKKHPDLPRNLIIKKAKQIIHQFNYDKDLIKTFSFSKGWFQRFRQRHDLKPTKNTQKKQKIVQQENQNSENQEINTVQIKQDLEKIKQDSQYEQENKNR